MARVCGRRGEEVPMTNFLPGPHELNHVLCLGHPRPSDESLLSSRRGPGWHLQEVSGASDSSDEPASGLGHLQL